MKHRTQLLRFQRAEDCFASHLLPPRARFIIAHDEVLVVDAGKMKVQHAPRNGCLPHQTGVTERSISRDNRCTSNHILDEMMISHQPNRISYSFAVTVDGEHHVGICDERRVGSFCISRMRQWIEHPLEM